jgi:hypothetical protein
MEIDKLWLQQIRPSILSNAMSQVNEGMSQSFSETRKIMGINKFILEREINSIPIYTYAQGNTKFYRVDVILPIQFSKAILTLMVILILGRSVDFMVES